MMRLATTFARWLFILSIPFLLLTASIALAVNSTWFYEYGFKKYDVSRTTGLAAEELAKGARGLVRYFNSNEEFINVTVVKDGQPFVLFNQREVTHLKDVKDLFWLDYRVLLGMLLFALVYVLVTLLRWRDREALGRGLLAGGVLTLGLLLTAGLAAILNFDRFFLQFHLLSFANDFWLLDPRTDYLVMMFPQGFWLDVTIFVVVATVVGAVAVSIIGWVMRKGGNAA